VEHVQENRYLNERDKVEPFDRSDHRSPRTKQSTQRQKEKIETYGLWDADSVSAGFLTKL
jgi:hypothetical protein